MIEFELRDELPFPDRRGHKQPDPLLARFADALRASPGKWGRWPNKLTAASARSGTALVAKGRYRSFPVGEFDARTRDGVLWVRYIGIDS